MMNLISLEDHFISTAMLSSPNVESLSLDLFPNHIKQKLLSLGSLRVQDMNAGNIFLQVVSSVPIAESIYICQKTNDQLHKAIEDSEQRLAGFAMLPMGDPVTAAEELERCVCKLGFLGALLPNHAEGKYYDGYEYQVFWKKAQDLDVPIYLHPSPASATLKPTFEGNYSDEFARMISIGGWGWHADVALHFLRLFGSGVFDAAPRLKLVLGHAGEMLPYMINRANRRLGHGFGKVERELLTVWKENIWITISGMWDLSSFACLVRSVATDRILYSVDYPFEKNEEGKDFMALVRESGLVSDKEWDMIASGNAKKLLNIKGMDMKGTSRTT